MKLILVARINDVIEIRKFPTPKEEVEKVKFQYLEHWKKVVADSLLE